MKKSYLLTSVKQLVTGLMGVVLISCGGGDGVQTPEQLNLPTGTNLILSCEEVGIADNQCILDDPINPYAYSAVFDENKWNLNDSIKTDYKAAFYLWATAQAYTPKGENQYYTALALHALYENGGSINAKNQAIKAYRSVLDNYFSDNTIENQDGTNVIVLVRNRVGEFIVNPAGGFPDLFDSETQAYDTLRSWGYDYDYTANTVSRL